MRNINCKIIQDLLPSYIDNICSNETKKAVEEHLAKCPECEAYNNRMMGNDICFEKSTDKDFNSLKMIRKNTDIKFFLFISIIIALSAFFSIYVQSRYSSICFLVIQPLLLFCNYLLLMEHGILYIKSKVSALSFINILVITYIPLLVHGFMNKWITTSAYPFSLNADCINSFVVNQLRIIMIIEIIIWICQVIHYIRTSYFSIILSGSCIVALYLSLYYIQFLNNITNINRSLTISRIAVGILLEGIVGIIIASIWYKKKSRNSHSK